MKCEQCGAPVTLEDEFCPYCGALNKPARQHIEDMKKYNRDYEATKEEVLENVSKQGKRHTTYILIGILIVANAVIFAARANTWEIQDMIQDAQVNSHADEYAQELDALESSGDYGRLYYYYNYNNLYSSEQLRSYDHVAYMGLYYTNIMEEIYYLTNPDVGTYYTQDQLLDYMAEYVVEFYDYLGDRDDEYRQEYFTEAHLAAMEDMESRIEAMLQYDCGLTQEEVDALPETSKQNLMLTIGRRMGIYE